MSGARETVDVLETPRCSVSTRAPVTVEEAETKTSSARETSSAVSATVLIQMMEVPSGTTWATGMGTCDDEMCVPSPDHQPDAQCVQS